MFTVRKDGLLIVKFRTITQIRDWAKRIKLNLDDCETGYHAGINGNEWTHAEYR